MANTVCCHLLALLSLAILTWTVAHAKTLQENEDEVLISERRDQQEAKEYEEAVEKRYPENEEEEEAKQKKEFMEKREPEAEAQENEDTEVLDLETRAVQAHFSLTRGGFSITGWSMEGLLLFNDGTVCGDHFSMNSAHAICKTMGYSAATRFRKGLMYRSYQSRKRILLDNVVCSSTHWASCRSTPNHNCAHNKDILLTCQGEGFKLINNEGERVTGQTEGLLTYQHGTVCDHHFNMNSAHAICRVMGYASAVRWRHGLLYGMMQHVMHIAMDDVRCSAAFWNRCTYRVGSHNCNHDEDVFLTCQPGQTRGLVRNQRSARL